MNRQIRIGKWTVGVIPLVCALVTVLLLLGLGGSINQMIHNISNKKEVNTAYISGKLEDMSELTTQKLTYTGLYSVTEGTIPFITQKGFSMVYTANMRAGIDFSQVEIEINKNTVKINVPHSTLQSVNIDASTIQFFDEKKALFNWSEKEDITEAIAAAEKDALEKSDYSEMLEQADSYAEILIHKLFDDSVGDREVQVFFK